VPLFKPGVLWEGSSDKPWGQNRTREIRPSGIVGGVTGIVAYTERCAPVFYPFLPDQNTSS